MSLRRHAVFQFFFALVLLLAQQGALTHEIWHAAKGGAPVATLERKVPDSKKSRLCDLHSALGSVLGAVSPVVAAASLELRACAPRIVAAASAASLSPLAPSSRGPPALL